MSFSTTLVVVTASLAAVSMAARAGPPELNGLLCTVARQDVGDAMRLWVRFENQSTTQLELPPGPHLIFYADSAAVERFDLVARMERIQRTPVIVPPAGSTEALYVVGSAAIASFACSSTKPAAAAMYFYKFSQQPQFRCLLRSFDLQSVLGSVPCPSDAQHSWAHRQ